MDFSFPGKVIVIGILGAGQLLAQNAPEAEDIRGPKPPVDIPMPDQPDYTIWIAIAVLVVLAIAGCLLWIYFKGKRNIQTPAEVALSTLSELGSHGDDLAAGEFAERAALSVRRYISGAFGIAAPNRTTEEFFRELPASSIRDDDGHLHAFLKSCDLAKFAAADLNRELRTKLVDDAKSFVTSTSTLTEGGKRP